MVSNKVIMKRTKEEQVLKKMEILQVKNYYPFNILILDTLLETKSDIRYTLLTYYENDNVIFCSAKQLNVLIEVIDLFNSSSITQLQYIESKHPDATFYQSVDFHFKKIDYIELKFDVAPKGWSILPCKEPCKVYKYVYNISLMIFHML